MIYIIIDKLLSIEIFDKDNKMIEGKSIYILNWHKI